MYKRQGVIASVINQMGSMLPNNVVGVIFFIVIFIVGHALNLAINLLGAYVHTNRLQSVSYTHLYAVYLISGSYDLLVTLEGKTLKEVSRFVSEKLSPLDGVLSTATHFILKKYKDHGTIMVTKKESERLSLIHIL